MSPPIWKSQVPYAITQLYLLTKAAIAAAAVPGGPQVDVHDGPFVSADSASQLIVIGWTGFIPGYQFPSRSMSETLQAPAATSAALAEGLAPSLRERFEIACASICRIGTEHDSVDIPSARLAAYANIEFVGNAVAANQTLNRTVGRSSFGATSELHEANDRRGALAVVTFTVECEGFSQQ